MRVFLTGATGYIGAAVLEALLRAEHDVSALVRGGGAAERLAERGARPVLGDLRSPDSYRDAAAGHDAYVHAAFEAGPNGVELDGQTVGTLIDLASGAKPSVVIYTSGIWVLGTTRQPAAEDASLNPPALVAWRPGIEQRVLSAPVGVRAIVVRPGLVYGGSRGIISDMLTDADNGLMRVVGQGENHWPVIYDRDLAELYVCLLEHEGASGLYHATDEADETVREMVDAIADHAPARPEVRFMPLEEARKKRGPLADALALDQIVRSPRAQALGWSPTLASVTRNIPRLFEEWRNARQEEQGA